LAKSARWPSGLAFEVLAYNGIGPSAFY
jgi:hypothetical protein